MRVRLSPLRGVVHYRREITCPPATQLTFGPYVVQIWSRYTLELRGNETLVRYRMGFGLRLCVTDESPREKVPTHMTTDAPSSRHSTLPL